jgi:hypothetical protein
LTKCIKCLTECTPEEFNASDGTPHEACAQFYDDLQLRAVTEDSSGVCAFTPILDDTLPCFRADLIEKAAARQIDQS